MNWYIKCIKNYFNFSGRARRKEYWIFTLFNICIIFFIIALSNFTEEFLGTDFPIRFLGIYLLFIIIPHLAVVVRRLHDINKSGTYWFIRFIPLVGPIWLLVLLCEDSSYGLNKWGPNPKDTGNQDIIDQIGLE